MKVVGLISSFREGRLLRGAVSSLLAVEPEAILVYEGPAGELPEGIEQAPESLLPTGPTCRVKSGRWRSDGRKRNEMLGEAKRLLPGEPLWGVWLDGDELLLNGEWLRDVLQSILWQDEAERQQALLVGAEQPQPTIHWPLRTVEPEGSMAVTTGRIVRLDLIRSYDVSVSAVTNVMGIEEGFGNVQEDARLWMELWMRAVEGGHLIAWPPKPGEPVIVHRSNLRHPARRGLRMHKQEREELKKAGKL